MQFTPVVRNSVSIVNTLKEFSKDRKIDVKDLDFELISYETFIKKEKSGEYEKVEDVSILTNEDYLNPLTEFAQEYSIKIMPLENQDHSFQLTLSANKLKTRVFVTLAKGSVFQKDKQLFHKLKSIIWHKKLRANIFVGFFEEKLDAQLKKLLQILPYGKKLPKDVKFSVGLGIDPIAPIDATLEKIYEAKNKNKSLIEGVEQGELIMKFHKPKAGQDGRSCSGRYIKVREPKNAKLRPEIDESVYEKELESLIEYYANKNGFVLFESGHLSISQTLSLAKADFKSTGNIDTGEGEKEVSVHIKHEESESDDAIGSGVKIDVKNLNVDGSIGSNVNIVTQELTVDAQTHKNSSLEVANSANIQLHRGDLKAANAEINILETGKVTASESIYIKKMLGGEAIAPVVKVDELLSNSTIIASERIEIKTLQGENNTLIIDPLSIESYHEKLDRVKERVEQKKEEVRSFTEKLENDLKEHSELLPRIQTFQKRVHQAIKEKKTPMKQDILRVKKYKKDAQLLQERQTELALQESELYELQEELHRLEDYDLYAKIILHTRYDGHTKVVFVNAKTKESVESRPEGKVEIIRLALDENNERVIKCNEE